MTPSGKHHWLDKKIQRKASQAFQQLGGPPKGTVLTTNEALDSQLAKAYAAGLKEGRRLERLAMKKSINVWCHRYGFTERSVREWLSIRLRTKRREGK